MQSIYPHTLVPYRGLKKQMSFDEILQDVEDLKSARRMKGIKLEYEYDEDCKRRLPDAVMKELYKELPDMSMNLLTDDSPLEYIRFTQKGEASMAWQGEDVDVAECIKSVDEVKEDYYPLVFNISKIHNKEFPYDSTFQSSTEFKEAGNSIIGLIEQKSKSFCKSNVYRVTGKFRVIHKPTKMNYWHVTLCIEMPKDSEPLKRGKAKDKCRYATAEFIKAALVIDYKGPTHIPRKHYVDPNVCIVKRSLSKFRRYTQRYTI